MDLSNEPLCVSTEELRAVGVELDSSEEYFSDNSGAETEVEEISVSMDPKRDTAFQRSQSKKRNVAHEEAVDKKKGGWTRGKNKASCNELPPKIVNQSVLRRMTTIKHTLDQIKKEDPERFKFHLSAEYMLRGKVKRQEAKKTFEFGEQFTEYVTKSQLQRELQDIRENVANKQVAASNPLKTPPRESPIPMFPSPATATESLG